MGKMVFWQQTVGAVREPPFYEIRTPIIMMAELFPIPGDFGV